MRKLKDLVEIRSGYTFRYAIDSFETGDTEVIQAKDLSDDFDILRRPNVDFKGDAKHLLKPGEILVSARGYAKAHVFQGKSRAVASSSLLVLTLKSKAVSPEFIALFFNSIEGIRAVFELSSGASVQSITKENLGQIMIPEIPPDKAHLLGQGIDAIDKYRAVLLQKQLYLDELRTSVISKTLKETNQ